MARGIVSSQFELESVQVPGTSMNQHEAEPGDWDGRKSDLIIGESLTGKKFLGCVYEGFLDGNSFFDWYQVDEFNKSHWLITERVERWMQIPFNVMRN